jgi:hypothetical protein
MDIHAIQQPTTAWLRLCLVDLRKAVESVQPNTSDTACDRHLDAMRLEELIATVEELYAQPFLIVEGPVLGERQHSRISQSDPIAYLFPQIEAIQKSASSIKALNSGADAAALFPEHKLRPV